MPESDLRAVTARSQKGCCSRLGNGVILLTRSTAHADRADDFTVPAQRYAACENHYASMVRGVDTEKLAAGLRVRGEIFGRNVEGARRKCFIDGNIDAAEPCAIPAHLSNKVRS